MEITNRRPVPQIQMFAIIRIANWKATRVDEIDITHEINPEPRIYFKDKNWLDS
jgi:hypothetical protein